MSKYLFPKGLKNFGLLRGRKNCLIIEFTISLLFDEQPFLKEIELFNIYEP